MSDKQREIAITGHALYDSFIFYKPHDTNAVISLKAHPFEEEARSSRAPVDLVAVIDISGSMSGHKLELVKQTLNFVVDQLKPDDRLAIITFHSTVKVEMTLTELTTSGKTLAKRITSELRAQGGTFLSGGLIEGLQLLVERASSKRKNEVASILFLTDGQASDGIMDKGQLKQTVQNYTASIPDVISINTFGFGADHDAGILTTVSESANGMFYFIEKNPDIAKAFGDCLGGLLSTVAQKISVEIEAAESVTITTLHSGFATTTLQAGKKYSIGLSDLFGEEERDIVLDLKIPVLNGPQESTPLVQIKVNYHNLITKAPGTSVGTISVSRPTAEPEKREAHITVLRQMHRLGVAKALKMAAEAGIRNDYKTGNALLQTAIDQINRDTPKDEFCQKLVGELKTAQNAMQNTATYHTVGYAQMQQQQVQHAQQRSNLNSAMYSNTSQMAYQNQAIQHQQQQIFSAPPPSHTAPSMPPRYTQPPVRSAPYPSYQPQQMYQQQQAPPQMYQQMQQQRPPQQQQMFPPQQQAPQPMQTQQLPSFDFTNNNNNNQQQIHQMSQQQQVQRQQQQQQLRQQQQQQQLFDFTVPQQQQAPLAPCPAPSTLSPPQKR